MRDMGLPEWWAAPLLSILCLVPHLLFLEHDRPRL